MAQTTSDDAIEQLGGEIGMSADMLTRKGLRPFAGRYISSIPAKDRKLILDTMARYLAPLVEEAK
ncbi:hypothetical protein [Celeribacter arenosi]